MLASDVMSVQCQITSTYLACSLLDICGQNQEEKLKLYKVL